MSAVDKKLTVKKTHRWLAKLLWVRRLPFMSAKWVFDAGNSFKRDDLKILRKKIPRLQDMSSPLRKGSLPERRHVEIELAKSDAKAARVHARRDIRQHPLRA